MTWGKEKSFVKDAICITGVKVARIQRESYPSRLPLERSSAGRGDRPWQAHAHCVTTALHPIELKFAVETRPLYPLFLNMFDKFLGIAHLSEDSEFLARSEIKLCKLHLNKLRTPDVYMDRYVRDNIRGP